MSLLGLDIKWPVWTRNKNGENFYDLTAYKDWSSFNSKLAIAQDHPILTPALLFVSKLFSQARFNVELTSSGKKMNNNELLKLLRNPNFYQTLPDLLESLMFTQLANGIGVLYTKKSFGTNTINALYVLDYEKLEFPDEIKKGYMLNRTATEKFKNMVIKYDKNGEDLDIKLGDLLFFYDLPNGVDKNPFKAASRLDGLKQTLLNTNDSLIAKNIILKTNGKEMLSGNKEGFPLDPDEKAEAEKLFNVNYGLSNTRKRGLITKANVTWKSLHIALRDLGLDESVKVDGNLIYTALHIPKDILSLEAKKTTYNNFKESMVSYIQNEMQATLDSFVAVFNKIGDDRFTLTGTYEHMPIMQYILLERYKGVEQQATALMTLRKAGVPDEVAIELCGFEPGMTLNPVTETSNGESKPKPKTANPKTSRLSEEEIKIRELLEEKDA